jgi:hypothetical protein
MTCNDRIAFESLLLKTEIDGSMSYEGVEFGKAAIVE